MGELPALKLPVFALSSPFRMEIDTRGAEASVWGGEGLVERKGQRETLGCCRFGGGGGGGSGWESALQCLGQDIL